MVPVRRTAPPYSSRTTLAIPCAPYLNCNPTAPGRTKSSTPLQPHVYLCRCMMYLRTVDRYDLPQHALAPSHISNTVSNPRHVLRAPPYFLVGTFVVSQSSPDVQNPSRYQSGDLMLLWRGAAWRTNGGEGNSNYCTLLIIVRYRVVTPPSSFPHDCLNDRVDVLRALQGRSQIAVRTAPHPH